MFTKLPLLLKIPDFKSHEEEISYGISTPEGFRGIQYLSVSTSQKEKILELIPEQYQDKFELSLMRINANVPIHTDSGTKCTINFYIEPNGYKTSFYVTNVQNPEIFRIKNQTNGAIFNPRDLTEVGSFIAEPDEVFLLDVTKPHGVTGDSSKERIAITLGSQILTYEEVLDILNMSNEVTNQKEVLLLRPERSQYGQ